MAKMAIDFNARTQLRAIAVSFFVSIGLMVAKFFAWQITDSEAILSDALESIVNVIASGFAWYSIYLSNKPRDLEHPYGYGKIEFFSAGIEGALIFIAGIYIIYEGIIHVISPHSINHPDIGAIIITITSLANAAVGYYVYKTGKTTVSLALEADGKHLMIDSISSVIVIASMILVLYTGIAIIDAIVAIIMGLIIVFKGVELVKESIAGLMDEADPETVNKIVEILGKGKADAWIDIHHLKVQKYGKALHIDCHLTLPYYLNLQQTHDEIEMFNQILEKSLNQKVETFIHADPCVFECCKYCRLSNCSARLSPHTLDLEWTTARLVENSKFFKSEPNFNSSP